MLRKMVVKCFMTIIKQFLASSLTQYFFFNQVFPSSASSDSISILSLSSLEVHCFANCIEKYINYFVSKILKIII